MRKLERQQLIAEFSKALNLEQLPISTSSEEFQCDQYLPDSDLWLEMDGAPGTGLSSITDGKKIQAYKELGYKYLVLDTDDPAEIVRLLAERMKIKFPESEFRSERAHYNALFVKPNRPKQTSSIGSLEPNLAEKFQEMEVTV